MAMDTVQRDELCEIMRERSSFYRLLSSVFFKEVTDAFIDRLGTFELPDESQSPRMYAALKELKDYLVHKGPDPRTDLAVDYAHIFLAAGVYEGDAACPFESIYTSEKHLVMQEARDEVRSIYLANGVSVDPLLHLPEDHLAFELEFLAIMSDRAADALSNAKGDDSSAEDGSVEASLAENVVVQRSFIDGHLLNWLPAFETKVAELAEQTFYPAIVHLTQAYVQEDAVLLDEVAAEIASDGSDE